MHFPRAARQQHCGHGSSCKPESWGFGHRKPVSRQSHRASSSPSKWGLRSCSPWLVWSFRTDAEWSSFTRDSHKAEQCEPSGAFQEVHPPLQSMAWTWSFTNRASGLKTRRALAVNPKAMLLHWAPARGQEQQSESLRLTAQYVASHKASSDTLMCLRLKRRGCKGWDCSALRREGSRGSLWSNTWQKGAKTQVCSQWQNTTQQAQTENQEISLKCKKKLLYSGGGESLPGRARSLHPQRYQNRQDCSSCPCSAQGWTRQQHSSVTECALMRSAESVQKTTDQKRRYSNISTKLFMSPEHRTLLQKQRNCQDNSYLHHREGKTTITGMTCWETSVKLAHQLSFQVCDTLNSRYNRRLHSSILEQQTWQRDTYHREGKGLQEGSVLPGS